MRLLVSVRSAEEALAAVAGGADIVDAKEPARGPLGAVDLTVLDEIAAGVPASTPVSAALGDFDQPAAAAAAVRAASASIADRPAGGYLKLGFHGAADPAAITAVLSAAVRAAGGRVGIVAAACAEGPAAGEANPLDVVRAAAACGAAGALLDTRIKDGRGLLRWTPLVAVRGWVASARRGGLLAAVAGGLDADAISALRDCGADLLGVRGAACDSGRSGTVNATRVAALKARLAGVTGGVGATS
ncbi:MAG TPA: (5-formylfuran-3-yl)methyl phosphate synthase [Gemmatimonadales bacterium]|nr:(5-formylfuran-3-yl)methyl phosphate synthase [Gemmatimonadales bacterium]